MSNLNTNLQTQSSNALHNAIMEAGSKDRPPIEAHPQCLQKSNHTVSWAEKTVPVAEGSSKTTTKSLSEISVSYKTSSNGPVLLQLQPEWQSQSFDDESMHKVQNNNDNYNVFAMENEHHEQPESSNDIYLTEQGDSNITIDSSDICYDRAQDDQDETDYHDQERYSLLLIIQKLKCEIDNKNRNKIFESSNKELLKIERRNYSTVKKSRNITRTFYKQVSKTCSWWYPKYTPSGYNWKPKSQKGNVNPNISMPLGNASRTANILEHKTPRTVKFGNDQIAPILGYGDLVQGTITIKRVYYVEGLNHNLFSVGQFCDANLEVAFWKSTVLQKTVMLKGKSGSSQSCGKAKRKVFFLTKDYPELKRRLPVLHMDLCGPMRVESINGKK
ncbi:hypothetical protein Tco_0939301 [Tanacetum coccineum]|uniref:Retrovirus-related Pol polyprotein from transposon TNT 1-94-like beta-barrel domain-containing protein n=1 Tax=Tanacetum coccineum TaxID=301880 RepID=A0ABQ5DMD4_9ASTR